MTKELFPLELEAIAGSGSEGSRWVEGFRSGASWTLLGKIMHAMRLFRGYGIDRARQVLDQVGGELGAADDGGAGSHLVRRWYLSARAYERYLGGDLEAADRLMDAARGEAVSALSRHAFLIPFATQFTDFDIQKARIARHRNDWDSVRRYLGRVRRSFAGEAPLCTLADGSSLSMHDVRAFYAEALSAGEHKDRLLSGLGHPSAMDRLEERICTLPDFVIPYP